MPFYLLKISSLYEKILSVEQGGKESKIKDIYSKRYIFKRYIFKKIYIYENYDWVLHKADSKTG